MSTRRKPLHHLHDKAPPLAGDRPVIMPSAPPVRALADIDAEQAAVLHAIGVKTYQRDTLASEIAGLCARVRTLNQEADADRAAMKAPTRAGAPTE